MILFHKLLLLDSSFQWTGSIHLFVYVIMQWHNIYAFMLLKHPINDVKQMFKAY